MAIYLRFWKAHYGAVFHIWMFYMLVGEISVWVLDIKTFKDSQGLLSILKLNLFSLKKEEARKSNTNSATLCNHNAHSHYIGNGCTPIFIAGMFYQWDFGFSLYSEGCLWSHQSTCGVRMHQRRVRPHGSHTDAVPFFPFLFLPIRPLSSIRTLSLQTWFNTREWIFVWGQIRDI